MEPTIDISGLQLVLYSVLALVAAIIGFFMIIKIVKWIEHGQYNRDRSEMDESSFYHKWHKYDVDGERDSWR
jgi:hypothetical protein